jgi:hypothetical protein
MLGRASENYERHNNLAVEKQKNIAGAIPFAPKIDGIASKIIIEPYSYTKSMLPHLFY